MVEQVLDGRGRHAARLHEIEHRPASRHPGRVPMTRSSRVEKPIVVSMPRPPRMAQRLAPLPRWATMTRAWARAGAISRRRPAAFATEDEEVTAKRIGANHLLGLGRRPVEAVAQINGTAREKHLRARRQADHASPFMARSTRDSAFSLTNASTLTRAPFGSMISIDPPLPSATLTREAPEISRVAGCSPRRDTAQAGRLRHGSQGCGTNGKARQWRASTFILFGKFGCGGRI
jgi:hypothetical protein